MYKHLKFLANSIQPMIFERFFNSTLNYAQYLKAEKGNEEFLISLIQELKKVLGDPTVQDISKKGIVSYVDNVLTCATESSDVRYSIFVRRRIT